MIYLKKLNEFGFEDLEYTSENANIGLENSK